MGKQTKNQAKKAARKAKFDILGLSDEASKITDFATYFKNETEEQTRELKDRMAKHNETQMAKHDETHSRLDSLNGKMDQLAEEKARMAQVEARHAEEKAAMAKAAEEREAKMEARHAEERARDAEKMASLEKVTENLSNTILLSAKKERPSFSRVFVSNDDDSSMGNSTLASKSTCSEKEKELMKELQKKDLEVKDREEQLRLFHAPDVMDINPVEQTQQSERQGKALQTHYDNHSKARLKKASMLPPRTPSKRRTRSSSKASN